MPALSVVRSGVRIHPCFQKKFVKNLDSDHARVANRRKPAGSPVYDTDKYRGLARRLAVAKVKTVAACALIFDVSRKRFKSDFGHTSSARTARLAHEITYTLGWWCQPRKGLLLIWRDLLHTHIYMYTSCSRNYTAVYGGRLSFCPLHERLQKGSLAAVYIGHFIRGKRRSTNVPACSKGTLHISG